MCVWRYCPSRRNTRMLRFAVVISTEAESPVAWRLICRTCYSALWQANPVATVTKFYSCVNLWRLKNHGCGCQAVKEHFKFISVMFWSGYNCNGYRWRVAAVQLRVNWSFVRILLRSVPCSVFLCLESRQLRAFAKQQWSVPCWLFDPSALELDI